MRVYKHYRPRTVWFPLVFLGALGLAALGGLAWSASKGFDAQPPFPAFLLMLAIAGFNLWIVGGSALEIRLEDGGFVEFVAPLRKVVRIAALDIISIAPSDLGQGSVFVLKHRNGSVRFDPRLTGMHELITELKKHNPTVDLRGI